MRKFFRTFIDPYETNFATEFVGALLLMAGFYALMWLLNE